MWLHLSCWSAPEARAVSFTQLITAAAGVVAASRLAATHKVVATSQQTASVGRHTALSSSSEHPNTAVDSSSMSVTASCRLLKLVMMAYVDCLQTREHSNSMDSNPVCCTPSPTQASHSRLYVVRSQGSAHSGYRLCCHLQPVLLHKAQPQLLGADGGPYSGRHCYITAVQCL